MLIRPLLCLLPILRHVGWRHPGPRATWKAESFELNPNGVAKAITPRTKAILLGYPANPTGVVMPADKLAEIASLAERDNLIVISDEITTA